MKGPDEDGSGGVAFRHWRGATFRNLPKLREPSRLRPWVRRIATREAVRAARQGRREPPLADPLAGIPAPDDPDLRASVRAVLASLKPEQRAILVLRDLEGLSEAEAAELLEVERGTVKSRLHRARAAFAARWST